MLIELLCGLTFGVTMAAGAVIGTAIRHWDENQQRNNSPSRPLDTGFGSSSLGLGSSSPSYSGLDDDYDEDYDEYEPDFPDPAWRFDKETGRLERF